jgi:actin-related protein
MIPATGSRGIMQERSGKVTGNRWNMESSIPIGICPDFFRWIPVNFLCFPAGTGRKSSKKIQKISDRNTASTKSPELLRTGSFRTGLFNLGIALFLWNQFNTLLLLGDKIPHAISHADFGGNDLTLYLTDLLKQRGHSFSKLIDYYHARLIKEEFVGGNFKTDDIKSKFADNNQTFSTNYQSFGKDRFYYILRQEIYRCKQRLYEPISLNKKGKYHILTFCHILSLISLGIHDMIIETINACDSDLQGIMRQSIILSGSKYHH